MKRTCSLLAQRFGGIFLVPAVLALSALAVLPGTALPAPAVTATAPSAGATGVAVNSSITATFSEPLDQATVTPGSFVLSRPVRVTAVAAGYNYTVVLKDNGTVSSWGYNGDGENRVPAGLGDVIAVSAGSNHILALKSDGTVIAWGTDSSGSTIVPPGLSGVAAIAAGGNHSVALKSDGTVTAWGYNYQGQTTVPGGLAGVSRIAAGTFHTLALKSDGTVTAWGDNSKGQTSVPAGLTGVVDLAAGRYHSVALKNDGTVVAWGANSSGQTSVPAGLSGVIAIAARLDNTIALKKDGTVVVWGDNTHGQATLPVGLSGITAIALGYYHAVALKDDGSVVSWGDNSCSQAKVPVSPEGITAVAAGTSHTVALKSDGTLSAWGYNSNGQADIPAGLSGVTALAAGSAHTLALEATGTVSAWGRNLDGQTTVPAGLTGVIAVAAGDNHSVALKSDGTVVAWGLNSSGQATVPTGLTNIRKIAAGAAHTLALKEDGTVTAWGSTSSNAATVPAGLSGVIAIAAGGYHSVALKSDGTLSTWGDNTQGQGTVPAGLGNVIAIAAGFNHTVALKNDGTVVAWGANDLGQSTVPAGLDRVVGIAAGNNYTVVVKSDGTLVGWGHDMYGQSSIPETPYRQEMETAISYSTASDSATMTSAATLPPATTLTATVTTGVRALDGSHPSADYSWSFTTVDTISPVTTPSPAGGTYTSALSVTLSANEPATIYYTTSGATPTTASPVYAGPIPIAATTTLKFFARDGAGNSETPQTATYTIVADTTPPVTTPSPAGGTYASALSVTLSANEPATVYYTTSGATPTTASPVYTGPIPIGSTTTLKFFARDTAGNSEAIKTATYTIVADTTPPITTPSPAGGTYASALSVTLTANEPATIYYTTSGATPTTASPVYTGPIPIGSTTTLKFFARDTAGNSEAMKSALYTILQNQTITFPTLAARVYGDAPFTPGATASSGLAVSYTSSNPAVATVSGATVTIVGAGSTVITATQGGNGAYNPAPPVNRTLTVTAAPLTVRPADTSRFYGAANPAFIAVYSGFVNNDTPSVLTGSPAFATTAIVTSPVGNYPITASQGSLASPNYSFIFGAGTLTVTRAPATVTLGDLAAAYDGSPHPATATTTPAGLSVSLTYNGSATAPVSAGSYPVVATVNDTNYQGSATGTLTIARGSQAITFPDLPATTYGDAPFTLGAAASSNLTVSYTSSNPAVATVSGATVTIVGAGTTVITASQGGDNNYRAATDVTKTLTVQKAAATVTLGSLTAVYDGTPHPATATASPAGLSVSLTYDGSASSPVNAGSYAVAATVNDPNYQGSATGTLTIARGDQSITFAPLPAATFGDAPFTLGATASSTLAVSYASSNPAVAAVSGATVTIVGAGTAVITASQEGNANYNAAPAVIQSLTVNKAIATVTLGSLSAVYDGTPKPATAATTPAGLTVDLTYSGTSAAPVNAGSYAVAATVNDPNYQGSASGTLIIAKADQAITFAPLLIKTYGDTPFTLGASASSTLVVAYASGNPAVATVSGATVTIVGAGTAVITASQPGNGNYNPAPAASQTLTVNKAPATITFGPLAFTYDGTPKPVTVTTVPAGLAVTVTYDGTATVPVDVGKYTVVASVNDANYEGTATATLEISKKSQTITFPPLPVKTYGDAPFTFTASASSNLNLIFEYDPAMVTITKQGQKYLLTILGAGTTVITATQPGNRNYSDAPPVSQTFVVNKAAATVTLGSLGATYDGTPHPAAATTNPAGLGVTFTYNGSPTAPTAAGSYAVVGTVSSSNYQGSASGTLTIAKAGQTITFAPLAAVPYGSAPFTPGAISSSGLGITYTSSNPAVATASGGTVIVTGIGTTTITASQGGDGNYTPAATVQQTLTVTRGTATVTLAGLSATYSGTAQAVTAATVPAGLGVTVTYNGFTTPPTAVGSYAVAATVTDPNYDGSASGTLTIGKGSQTITFGALPPKTYGDPAFSLAATSSSSLAVSYASSNPAVATVIGTTVTIVGAGTTVITASQGGDANYNAAAAFSQNLTVAKATATVTLDGLAASYTGSSRGATATTVPAGLPVTLTYNGSATAPTAAGSYTVLATVTGPNYQGSTTGTLTITKGSQTISFGSLPVKTVGNAPFTLGATATSGLAVSYTSSNPAVATVSGSTVTIVGAGTTVITASQGGDANYTAAPAVSQTLTVNAPQAGTGKSAVTIGTTTSYYDTLAATLASIPAGATTTVRLQATTFAEAVTIATSGAVISITGGYDSGFTGATGMTTIQGNLVISSGMLVVDRLAIM